MHYLGSSSFDFGIAGIKGLDKELIGPRHFKYASRHMSCIITQFLIYMV